MQRSEALTMLRESIGDNNPDDQQIFSDDELNFMLDAALAQVNQVRPRSVRETIDLNVDEDTYVLSDVQTVTRIDWLRDNKFIRELPPKAWEVWGTNEFDEFEYGQDNVLVFITEPFRAFGNGDYQARVHGYAPWVWDDSEDCEDDVYDWITPENSATAVSGNNVTTTPPLEEGIDHAWWGGNWGDSAVDIYAEPVTYAEGIPSHLVSISLTCDARGMDDGGTPHTMGTGIKLRLWEEGHDPDYEAPDYVYTDPGGETDQWQALSIQANLPPNIAAFQWFGGTNGSGNMAYGNVQITLGCTEFEDPQSPDSPET